MNINDWKYARILLAPDGDDGGTSGGDDEAREQGFQRLLDRNNNDGVVMARDLYRDNYNLRRRNGELTTKIQEAEAKVPKEGTVVLTPEQSQAWAAYQALGTPDEVQSKVGERDLLQGKMATLERDETLRQVAEVAGYKFTVLKSQDMLETKVNGKAITYDVREVDENGVKVKRPFIKDGETEKPLAEYAQEHWVDLLPSLAVQQETTTQSRTSGNGGTQYPPQHQGSGGGSRSQSPKQQTQATLDKSYTSREKK